MDTRRPKRKAEEETMEMEIVYETRAMGDTTQRRLVVQRGALHPPGRVTVETHTRTTRGPPAGTPWQAAHPPVLYRCTRLASLEAMLATKMLAWDGILESRPAEPLRVRLRVGGAEWGDRAVDFDPEEYEPEERHAEARCAIFHDSAVRDMLVALADV